MEMTIKQLADELAVSKSTIGRAIVQLGFQDQLCKIGNKYMLSETQILQIKLQLSKDEEERRRKIASGKFKNASRRRKIASGKFKNASRRRKIASGKFKNASRGRKITSSKSRNAKCDFTRAVIHTE